MVKLSKIQIIEIILLIIVVIGITTYFNYLIIKPTKVSLNRPVQIECNDELIECSGDITVINKDNIGRI